MKYKYTHEIFIGADWNAPIPKEKDNFYKRINEWINDENLFTKKTKSNTGPSSNNKLDYFITNSTLKTNIVTVKSKGIDGKVQYLIITVTFSN